MSKTIKGERKETKRKRDMGWKISLNKVDCFSNILMKLKKRKVAIDSRMKAKANRKEC